MTSTKTYYLQVLRTIFTERKIQGIGDQPAFDDIASFEDFWNVRKISINSFIYKCKFLGYEWTYSRWFI